MPVLTDAGIELITSKFNEADTDSTGSINAEQLTTILTPFCESEGYDIPNEEQIAKRLASLKTEKPGELTLIELLFVIAYMKIMLICEVLFMAADKDGSGVLEPNEIKDLIRKVCERDEVDPPTIEEMDAFIADIGGEVPFDLFALIAIPRILAKAGIQVVEDISVVEVVE